MGMFPKFASIGLIKKLIKAAKASYIRTAIKYSHRVKLSVMNG